MKSINVVAAVIEHKGKILAVQRGPAKYPYISEKWEFPGGKVEGEESLEQAIIREIKEELDMDIEVSSFLMTVEHSYPDFHLTMHSFRCVAPSTSLRLTVHLAFEWLEPKDLMNPDWAAADVPIVKKLMDR